MCGSKLTNTQSFFLKPCDFKHLNIVVIDNCSFPDTITISAKEVKTKCLQLSLPNSAKSVIIPLIHYRD